MEYKKEMFVDARNYDVGRNIELAHLPGPAKISTHSPTQNKILYEFTDTGCKWVYIVDKETQIVESWQYVSSRDKCYLYIGWFEPW